MAILSGIGLEHIIQKITKKMLYTLTILLVIIPTLFFSYLSFDYKNGMKIIQDPNPEYTNAVKHIIKTTNKYDTIFVWGWFTPLYVESKRISASRFVYCSPLTGDVSGTGIIEKNLDTENTIIDGSWRMLMDDLNKYQPKLILDTSIDNFSGYSKYPIKDFSIIKKYLSVHYYYENTIDGIGFYRLKKNSKSQNF